MENQKPKIEEDSRNEVTKKESNLKDIAKTNPVEKRVTNLSDNPKSSSDKKVELSTIPKKTVKPPKIEDKPFEEFISEHLIPGLKSSIEAKGTLINEIKLIEGKRPVVGGKCWMVFCEMYDQRKFWLCFNKELSLIHI